MTEWAYVAVDTQLGYALADLPLVGVSMTLTLNGAGSMTATMPLGSDAADLRDATVPLRTTIYALANGNPVFGGLVMGREVDLGAREVKLTIIENWAWFSMWQFGADTLPYSGSMQWLFSTLLLPDSMGVPSDPDTWLTSAPLTLSGGLAHFVTRPGYVPPSITLDAVDKAARSGADVISTLSQAAHPYGFDFGLVHRAGPDLVQTSPSGDRFLQPYISLPTFWYPWRGDEMQRVFEWPGDAVTGTWQEDASNVAAKVTVEGAGLGKTSTITATAYNPQLLDAGWPWTETSVRLGQVSKRLGPVAQSYAAAAREPNTWPQLTVSTDSPNIIGSYGLGDLVRARVTHPWFGPGPGPGVDEIYRVQAMTITPEGQQAEAVALTLMPTWSAT